MSDKMREEFEAWAKRHHGVYSTGSVCGHYSNEKVNQDWFIWCMAWQASRAAVVVELPLCRHSKGVQCYDLTEVKVALNKAGVNYK